MTNNAKIALNPLPWVLTADGFDLSVSVLRQVFSEIRTTPFKAIHADPPQGQSADEYPALLAEYGLAPAPGYFSVPTDETPVAEIVEAAKKHAVMQAEPGNTEVFIAASADPPRRARPAVGADPDPAVLSKVIDNFGAVAAAMTAQAVRPVLHPQVGSRIGANQ